MTDKPDTSPEALLELADRAFHAPTGEIKRMLRALADEKSAWTTRKAELEHQLRNLLAIIFRDGGQRAAAYPTLAEAVEAAHLEWAELVRERDEARGERDKLEHERGDWTGETCPACNGHGQDNEAHSCKSCAGTGEVWATWKERAERAEADAAAMIEWSIRKHGRMHGWTDELREISPAGRDLLARMERMKAAVETVIGKFKQDQAQGYRSKDRTYAIEVLGAALADQPGEKG